MYKSSAIAFFGNGAKLAAILNITNGAVYQWPDIIPEKQAMKLERITGGILVYDASLYEKHRTLKRSKKHV